MGPINLEKIPKGLKDRKQWVCWRPNKTPVDPKSGKNAKADDPDTWATVEEAMRYYQGQQGNGIAGIGYEFSTYDPCAGLDLDACMNPETGELRYCARVLLDYLDSYSEFSPSRKGAHIITKAKWPQGASHKKAMPCGMKIEVYDTLRYFTMTGAHLEGTPTTIESRQKELETLHRTIFAKPKEPPKPAGPGPTLELSDRELIDKACGADDGGKFERLWTGDTTGYNIPSEADYALAHKLAWWANKDPDRIDRLFRRSGLCQDPGRLKKWERLSAKTIEKAITNTPEGYTPHQVVSWTGMNAGQETPTSPQAENSKALTLKTLTARELAAIKFSPRRWAVPDLVTEGLTILAGRPKTGKSWLALNMAVAVATGGVALGKIKVEAGEVLFLALEDGPRRIQERLAKIVPFGSPPDTLHIATAGDLPPLHRGGTKALEAWLKEHPAARLVVIDTLARVKPGKKHNQESYEHDTAVVAALQKLSIDHGAAIVVIHYTRKVQADDFLEEVSGTYGLTGTADCVAVLARKARGEMDGTLKLTGRDIEEQELALKFTPDLGSWELLGESREFTRSPERQDILLILKEHGPSFPKDVSEITGKNRENVKKLMAAMHRARELKKDTSGKYYI